MGRSRPREPDRRAHRLQRGLCLPIALPHRTFIALKPREDTKVRVVSDVAPDKVAEADLDGLKARGVDGWSAYPTGVAWALREAGFSQVKGFDAAFVSCVQRRISR